jgi:hypothetical protein
MLHCRKEYPFRIRMSVNGAKSILDYATRDDALRAWRAINGAQACIRWTFLSAIEEYDPKQEPPDVEFTRTGEWVLVEFKSNAARTWGSDNFLDKDAPVLTFGSLTGETILNDMYNAGLKVEPKDDAGRVQPEVQRTPEVQPSGG